MDAGWQLGAKSEDSRSHLWHGLFPINSSHKNQGKGEEPKHLEPCNCISQSAQSENIYKCTSGVTPRRHWFISCKRRVLFIEFFVSTGVSSEEHWNTGV